MADSDTDTTTRSATATNVINGVTYIVDTDDYQAVADLQSLEQVEHSIKKTSAAIVDYEDNGALLQKQTQEIRKAIIEDIRGEIADINEEKFEISDLSVEAKDEEVFDKNGASILRKSSGMIAFSHPETPLEDAVNEWFKSEIQGKRKKFISVLYPSGKPKSIYEDNEQWFSERKLPLIANVFDNEAASRSIAISNFEVKLLVLETVGSKQDFLPSQPNAAEIKALMRDLEVLGRQRQELHDRIAARQAEMASRAGPVATGGETVSPSPEDEPTPPEQQSQSTLPTRPIPSGPLTLPIQPTKPGDEEAALKQESVQKYRDILISRDPNLTPEEATLRASQLVNKLQARRDELVGRWVGRMQSANPGVDQKVARKQAEMIVDLQLAENEAEALGKGKQRSVTGKEMVNISQRPTRTRETKPLRGELTLAQKQSRELVAQRAESKNFSFREMVRHPSIPINLAVRFVGNYFKKFFGSGEKKGGAEGKEGGQGNKNAPVALLEKGGAEGKEGGQGNKNAPVALLEKGGGKVAGKVAKKTVTTVLGLVLKGALAAIPTGVTQVIAAALVIKDKIVGVLSKVAFVLKKIIPKEIQENIKDLWSKMKIGIASFFGYMLLHPLSLIAGAFGGFVAGPLGAVAGFVVGLVSEGIIANLLGLPGAVNSAFATGLSGAEAGVGGALGSIGSGFGTLVNAAGGIVGGAEAGLAGLVSGTGIGSIAFWAVPVTISGLSLTALILSIFGIGTVAAIAPESVQGQTRQALFSLTKSADPTDLSGYSGDLTTVTYTIHIKPEGDNPLKIVSINDKISRLKGGTSVQVGNIDVPVPTDDLPTGATKDLSYQFTFSGSEYIKSTLLNFVTVVGKDSVTGDEETQTAAVGVRIASPLAQQPYGYPSAGTVTSLDLDSGGQTHWSCFFIFYPCVRVDGGIDIAAVGGTPVKATLEGEVIYEEFRLNDVGGVIYIQSDDGTYVAEYEHLEDPSTSVTLHQRVTRGTQIGTIFNGPLPATHSVSGHPEHVHYQVVVKRGNNLANVFFTDPANIGLCSDGKILPSLPGNIISEAGPFDDCQ